MTASHNEPYVECHGLDTPSQVFFYEQDFYVLSNFSAFAVEFRGILFPTAEHAYHWCRFDGTGNDSIQERVRHARSAHDAFTAAQHWKGQYQRLGWDLEKVGVMRQILMAKQEQHEYVRRKVLATGDRELIENSWRDSYWGWGPNRDGMNMLGKLWMEVRTHLRGRWPA